MTGFLKGRPILLDEVSNGTLIQCKEQKGGGSEHETRIRAWPLTKLLEFTRFHKVNEAFSQIVKKWRALKKAGRP